MLVFAARTVRIPILAAIIFFASLGTAGASIDDVIGVAGGVNVSGNLYLSFTVGEAIVEGGGSTTIVTSGFQQPSSYDYWSTANGLVSGPQSDTDGDGLPNLLEFAYGTNPRDAVSVAKAEGSIGPGDKLYITADKGTSAGDLLWIAEVSIDLISWTSSDISVALDDSTTFSALYTGAAPVAFMRLRLQLLHGK